MSTLQSRPNINHLEVSYYVLTSNLHRNKCYSCFSLLYQMSWSLCVSLERGRVSGGTFQYKHHWWGREGPGQSHCTVSGPGGRSRGIRLLLHKAGRRQCKQLPGCSTWVSYPTRSSIITEHQAEHAVIYSRFHQIPIIFYTRWSVYVNATQFAPPSPSPRVSTSPFSTSVSLFLPCK